jgi:hypothetical protein
MDLSSDLGRPGRHDFLSAAALSTLGLDDRLVISETRYQVVGTDSYTLHNCLGQVRRWTSYTLANAEHRHWLTSIDDRALLWRSIDPIGPDLMAGLRLNPDMSGTATIKLAGDPGPSTPLAQLLWFEATEGSQCFAFERFLHLADQELQSVTDHYFIGEVVRG